ncbi:MULTISPECIES: phosphoribosylglycinamide synthetase [Sphingobium]|jgi:D-alanine-D-alanine ligase|uniref:D-alanine--D-alanine ligase n=2 Tax=Sphingobium fuliginis (strain ATCC 27551) TaxID=336203 RepID=A0A292ZIK7_SPHSA|nr:MULTISPECIES: phosphoribosylglycinamide synthetase [Sphingobium]AJR24609.1 phosphoribosylglycinamide synthetase [Sphingobium sp. YBL2]QDC35883.1 phosphoribosylglycinamide synthetase [Sphingobium fuliginis ATCC 27551]QOT71642.1 phosphoribosylglycinamide synthetase [Sphingobium fuliginis]RYL99511.1 phosphoribosylglycinamide synthetase [Sphingobium fuliginis]UXC90941.1 phosphoribosylglycinamide synthetase [Sphingobium sp. RSMS]
MTTSPDRCMRIPAADKARLRVLFLAKHACAGGRPDAVDGNHAIYHHEMRSTLEGIGLHVAAASRYDALFERPDADFVVTLLNRGGFQNSEMLAPLLLSWRDVPFLGASPIVRGVSDDKYLSKLIARARGVPTMKAQLFRRGGLPGGPAFAAERLVVKPNASSASWGLAMVDGWAEALVHADRLFDLGHDVLVEAWAPLLDVAVPVVGGSGNAPWVLPPMMYVPADPHRERSYEEKRGLVDAGDDPLVLVEDRDLRERLEDLTRRLLPEFWPFDYGRFEFRYDPATDALLFMELNLSCNLWSKKTISRSARSLGVDHPALVETIVAHSLLRQGLLRQGLSADVPDRAAA